MLPRLPLDLSTFSELRRSGYLYVDKTKYAYSLITGGRRYFLSRPRRFGKSLFISTLKEILAGNRDIFDGLWIDKSDYNWQEHAVIKLDFSELGIESREHFINNLIDVLIKIGNDYGLTFDNSADLNIVFRNLVFGLHKKFGKVAVLIDEYDRPILQNLHNNDLALQLRFSLQNFFTQVKSFDEQISFVLITGVSSFTKAGLFSGINNLRTITLNSDYSGICGYTEEEVDVYFSDYIKSWAEKDKCAYLSLRQKIKDWYNGYSFGVGAPTVYNPFSLMNSINHMDFKNYWFQSATPTFLVEILKKDYRKFNLEKFEATDEVLGIFDVGSMPLMALMFQSGYLTIVGYDREAARYKLDYPNFEVRLALQKYLIEVFARIDALSAQSFSSDFSQALANEDIEEAVYQLKQLFAHVPYQLHIKEEKFYHALLQMVCTAAGIKAQSEYSTSHGRIDMVINISDITYVVEIKFNQSADDALDQIVARRYYDKFISSGNKIILLGLSFQRKPGDFDITYASKSLC